MTWLLNMLNTKWEGKRNNDTDALSDNMSAVL